MTRRLFATADGQSFTMTSATMGAATAVTLALFLDVALGSFICGSPSNANAAILESVASTAASANLAACSILRCNMRKTLQRPNG